MSKFPVYLYNSIIYVFLVGIVIITSLLVVNHTLASSPDLPLEIIGSNKGLQVEPEGKQLFNIDNLYPGIVETSSLRISNIGQKKFALLIGVEKKAGDDLLFRGVDISISKRGSNQIFYSGPLSGINSINIGDIQAVTSVDLDFAVSLNKDAGKECQGKSLELTWKLIAAWPDDGELPPEPPGPSNGGNGDIDLPPEPPGADNGEDGENSLPPEHPDPGNGEDDGNDLQPELPGYGEDGDVKLSPETPRTGLPKTGGNDFLLMVIGIVFLGTGFLLTRIRDKED